MAIFLLMLLLLLSRFSRVRLYTTPGTAAHQAPLSLESPGKNPAVGCHFLLQCMKVKSQSEIAQSCPTVSNLMDYSLPGSSVHGIFLARVLEWGATAFSYRRPFLKSQLKSEIWEATSSHSMTLLQMFHFFSFKSHWRR